MKRLTVELEFSKSGRPMWGSVRLVEWKEVKRKLKRPVRNIDNGVARCRALGVNRLKRRK